MNHREVIIGACRLILGDCLTVMRQLPNVAGVLTDPPYGIDYGGLLKGKGDGKGGSDKNGWKSYDAPECDKERPDRSTFEEIRKIAPRQIIWGGNYFTDYLPPSMRWLVWDKGQRGFSLADCEFAWVNENRAARIFTYPRAKALQDGKVHPTQKPVELMIWCLTFLPQGTVLDPFMGSGTTGVACVKQGRPFIGIEIDAGYFEIACERIRKAYAQPDMFVHRPADPKQESLF
ncbi:MULTISPECIES: DNA methyltransferase [unclassified Mesorhizobium]|uniref:DNA-methyltransferase n=1 Tax=unclassified Mesorhizobium TaxID=325217 RepID=UPI003337C07A